MDLLEQFNEHLRKQGKARNTIQNYVKHIEGYFRWYKETYGEECKVLYHVNILDYRSYLQNICKLKYSSIDVKLSALSSFNDFLIEEGVQTEKVIFQKDRLKVQMAFASPSDLEKQEVDAFLQTVLTRFGKRNYAIATLLAYGGLRISECLNVKIMDFSLQARELQVIGKGNKQRIVYLNDKIIHALREYLKDRTSLSEYLFTSRTGGKLDRTRVNKIFNECSDHITPHTLRHFYCTHALETGYTIAAVANQVGHSDVRTTMLYTNPSRKEMKEKANQL